ARPAAAWRAGRDGGDRAVRPGQRRLGSGAGRAGAAGRLPRPDGPLPRGARQERLDHAGRLVPGAQPDGRGGGPAGAGGGGGGAAGGDRKPGDDERTRQLRGDLFRALGTLGNDPATQARAADWYARYLAEPAAVDTNVVAASIPVLAHVGDAARYDQFLLR